MPDCSVTGCVRQAEVQRAQCSAHRKRAQRGRPLADPIGDHLDPFARFVEACIGLADAPAEDDPAFDLALDVARKATCAWMRSIGWAPSAPQESVPSVSEARGDAGLSGHSASTETDPGGSDSVREGQERESGRHAEVGPLRPQGAASARAGGPRDARQAARLRQAGGAMPSSGSDSRPRRIEAVQPRAGQARRERK